MSIKDTKVLLGKLPLEKILDIKPTSSQENLRKEAMMHLHIGFSMTSPYVHEAVDKACNDGVGTLILSHQGAQHSKVTSGILFRDTMNAIKNYPDWNVRVIGIKSFSDDKRFVDLIVDNIEEDLKKLPKTEDDKTCILLPVHGNLQKLVNAGDPSIGQMLDVIDNVKQRLPNYHYHYGFQNHDEIPLIKWTTPNIHEETHRITQDLCEKIPHFRSNILLQ